jgi:hypothetical protein
MKRVLAGVALVMGMAGFSSAKAVCVYADRQYSEGAGSWTKLELPQTQPNACERAYLTPNSFTFTVSPDKTVR